jgi:hypothetical protein
VQSWRESASDQAQADLDALLNLALPHAHQLLRTDGKFSPFAAEVRRSDEIGLRPAYSSDGHQRPRPAEALEWLYDDARREAGDIRAVAFVADVRSNRRDAIAFQLEHRDRIAIAIVLPYVRSRFHKAVSLGPMRATPGVPRLWPDSAGT